MRGVAHTFMIFLALALVNALVSRYPAPMEPISLDSLRVLARTQGLELSDEELAGLLPLVQAGRSLMDSLRETLTSDVEPSSQYRMM